MVLICFACKKKINEATFMEFKDRYYHMDHFKCTSCKDTLMGKKVNYGKNVDGDRGLYCPKCYTENCHPVCQQCTREIKGNYFEACSKYYHPHHFACMKCGNKLGLDYKKHNNQPYCEDCFVSVNKDKCSICRKVITEKRSIVGEKMFHFDCFRCFYCEELMGSGDCVYDKGKYFHYQCYMDSEAPECHFCKGTIIGEYLRDKQNENPVHMKCLNYYQDMQDL